MTAVTFPGQGSQILGMAKDFNDNFEIANVYLDEMYLNKIAKYNNGIYYNINDYENLLINLNTDKIISVNYIRRDILSYQYLLIILIFLLISEWYIRNKIGLP